MSSLSTWFYDVTQMTHSMDDFNVTLLFHVVRYELRPPWILQYFNEYVVQRTVVQYVCTAVIPSPTINHLLREFGLKVK